MYVKNNASIDTRIADYGHITIYLYYQLLSTLKLRYQKLRKSRKSILHGSYLFFLLKKTTSFLICFINDIVHLRSEHGKELLKSVVICLYKFN